MGFVPALLQAADRHSETRHAESLDGMEMVWRGIPSGGFGR